MKKLKVKELYRQEKNALIIDIDICSYRDIYNSWDFSPELKRGLDNDLVKYLEECCKEIPSEYSISIIVHMPKAEFDDEKEVINKKCFHSFFCYKIDKLQIKKRNMYQKAFKLTSFGLIFLIFSVMMRDFVSGNTLLTLLKEGFFIGAWVLIWELFTTIFIWNSGNKEEIVVLNRLSDASIKYKYREGK